MTTAKTSIFKCPFSDANLDFNKQPNLPPGWSIYSHNLRSGYRELRLNSLQFELFGLIRQYEGSVVAGKDIYREVQKRSPLPANLLDHFLSHPDDIPEELKGDGQTILYVFFWDTVYLNDEMNKCVRGMYFENEWKECAHCFDDEESNIDESWPSNCLALIAA